MSSWQQIKKINECFPILESHYKNNLPLIIRDLFAHWIEEHPWENLSGDQEYLDNYGKQFINSFMKEIQAKIQSNSIDCDTRNLLNNYCNQLSRFFQNPQPFICNLKDGIILEKRFLGKLNVSWPFF